MIDLDRAQPLRAQRRVPRWRRLVPLSVAVQDAVLIYTAFVLAYWTRYSLKVGPHIREQLSFSDYQPIGLLLLAVMMPVLLAKGAYRQRLSTEMVDEITTVFSAATITVAAIVVVEAMLQKYQYSRGVILYVWLLVIVTVGAGRALYRSIQGLCHRRGWGVRHLLVVGASDVSKMVMQRVVSRPDLGYHLVGFVDHREGMHVRDFGRFRNMGTVQDLPELIESRSVDDVILALPASAHEEVWRILALCEQNEVGVKLVPDLFEMSLSRVQVDDIAGIPLLDVREQPIRLFARACKRLIDVLVSALGLVIALPLLLALALLIRLETPGSPLLRQERVGLGGRRFKCLKLRTMRPGAEEVQPELMPLNENSGPIFKMRDDPRCTPLGRLIRRWSLDELPQLWNVLVGDMSLVGPRPPLPSEVAKYEPEHMRRLEIKPGMTGIWQVSGRSDLLFDEMIVMDTYYVENWSPTLDVRILIRTVIAVLTARGAY